jgi:hypothetical protein
VPLRSGAVASKQKNLPISRDSTSKSQPSCYYQAGGPSPPGYSLIFSLITTIPAIPTKRSSLIRPAKQHPPAMAICSSMFTLKDSSAGNICYKMSIFLPLLHRLRVLFFLREGVAAPCNPLRPKGCHHIFSLLGYGNFQFACGCVCTRARQTARISFLASIPSLRKMTKLQGEGLGRQFWLIRSLRTGSQSATTK